MEWLQGLFGPKCILCGKKGPRPREDTTLLDYCAGTAVGEDLSTVSWVHRYGMYLDKERTKQWYFHPTCVEKVLCKPEIYGHAKVDLALEIVDRKDTERAKKEQARLAKLEADLQYKTKVKAACRRVAHGLILLD